LGVLKVLVESGIPIDSHCRCVCRIDPRGRVCAGMSIDEIHINVVADRLDKSNPSVSVTAWALSNAPMAHS